MTTSETDTEIESLIVAAFEVARASGRQDWRRMTAAVLKNRLLQVTSHSFDEKKFGYERFTDLLEASSNIVELDRTTRPANVHLLATVDAEASPSTIASAPTMRVRSDLWHAIIDYSSGKVWVWDAMAGQARVEADGDDLPSLPTISHAEMTEMRSEFASELASSSNNRQVAIEVDEWAAEERAAFVLSPEVRHKWFATLKREVVKRLADFFEKRDEAMPTDAVQPRRHAGRDTRVDDDLAMQRSVIEIVKSMTAAELSELRLPAAAIFRSQRQLAKSRTR
ncbi:OST-HTH/LOTUS domain-containing protein [Candidatus Microthrix parvicella]|uniref:OST-HTH/LOTUS domain-containing protein n=1 Tax=Candidatus Neomicrothrix parvicella TaxID=41950 RepID=UPI000372B9AA|nr:OST-HTH/LOTUS domain-containing protein [Candidatus Microthrix parvicella]